MTPIHEIDPSELRKRLMDGETPQMIDVREDEEVAQGMISGAKHIPLGQIPDRLDEIPKEGEVIMICRSGGRSMRACQFLQQHGIECTNMTGGMLRWNEEE
ncbi:rhodanese-like domain-containing protein [Paenibacillus chibensis]|uniref:Rhodanese-like domain-containing protein n=1 Tax=Paenibacillus chibensis TaxID=59846 RepID=A0ABU6PZC8_9BACL|nr:rhodanese-like domain-containing protein [Paenibacillus chibensis]MEC0371845.1 rhodanese-like domain-containing protein [Paenibacillus chibensis]MED5020251.1 rhodanese-like domain-containing protein [Paenibacillus chibensis]